MVLISGSILVLMWILGHDFSGHYNRLALMSVDIISGVYCIRISQLIIPLLATFINVSKHKSKKLLSTTAITRRRTTLMSC